MTTTTRTWAALGSAFLTIACAFAQGSVTQNGDVSEVGGDTTCFKAIDKAEFDKAEKEATGTSIAFSKKQKTPIPSISPSGTVLNGAHVQGVFFDRWAVDYPALVPGISVRFVIHQKDGSILEKWFVSRGPLDSFTSPTTGKKVKSPYIYFAPSVDPQSIEVTVLGPSRSGVRTKYVGTVDW